MNKIKLKAKTDTSVRVLLKENDFSKRSIDEILNDGYSLNDNKVFKNNKISNGDEITIEIAEEDLDYEPIYGNLDILYEDENIIIINKESNLTVNSKNMVSLANHIAYYFKENNIKSKIRFVNRLDMNTSGIIMIAKNKYSMAYYQKKIEENRFIKKYIAIVEGMLDIDREEKVKLSYNDDKKTYDVSNDGSSAITYFRTLDVIDGKYSIIEADIKTGKTHQIRSTLKYLDHPIIGDTLYGSNIKLDRFLLHAYKIAFNKFLSKERVEITSEANFPILNDIY